MTKTLQQTKVKTAQLTKVKTSQLTKVKITKQSKIDIVEHTKETIQIIKNFNLKEDVDCFNLLCEIENRYTSCIRSLQKYVKIVTTESRHFDNNRVAVFITSYFSKTDYKTIVEYSLSKNNDLVVQTRKIKEMVCFLFTIKIRALKNK